MFDSRVVISNPGGLPSGLKPSEFGHKSVARNPLIASLLQRIDYIEKVGTGIGRIRNAVAENKRSTVEFSYDDFFSVIFNRQPAKRRGFDAGFDKVLNEGLNEGLKSLLSVINQNPGIQARQASELLGHRPLKTIERQIKTLTEMQLIERRGSKKTGGYWIKVVS